jgi:hypothetical protein
MARASFRQQTAIEHRAMTVPSASTPLFRRVILALRELAPYAALELLLPGGSLVALILWLHARRRARRLRYEVSPQAPPLGIQAEITS